MAYTHTCYGIYTVRCRFAQGRACFGTGGGVTIIRRYCSLLFSKPGLLYTSVFAFAFCLPYWPRVLARLRLCLPPPTFLCSAPPCSVQLSQNQSLSGGALTGGTKQNIWNPLSHPFPFPSPHSSICGAFSHPRHISHLVRKILAVRHESIPSH